LAAQGWRLPRAREEDAGDHGFPSVEEDEIRWGSAMELSCLKEALSAWR
jgi:hypothetical protein